MRIIIDLQGAQTESRFRGIGRYNLSLSQAIVRNRGEHDIFIVMNGSFPAAIESIRAAFDGVLPQENIRVWYAPRPVRESEPENEWRREAAERIREMFLVSLEPDVIHVPSLFEGYIDDAVTSIGVADKHTPTVVTLHDLIPLLNPKHYLNHNPAFEQHYMRKLKYLKRADFLIGDSDFLIQEGQQALGFPESRMCTVHNACVSMFQKINVSPQETEVFCSRHAITRSILLYTGAADERKNLHRLICAFALLPDELRSMHQLVMAGKMSENEVRALRDTARRAGVHNGDIVFTGYVSDDELVLLYNICKLFVFPSWYEGFGLPALEAMACGAPTIAADASSLPEVVGCVDALFNPFNERAIAQKMVRVLTDKKFRLELGLRGVEQARKFTWDKSALKTIEVYEKIYKVKKECISHVKIHNVLIDAIARIKGVPTEQDLVMVSSAVAVNHTRRSMKKIFIDISELAQHDARTGIQRVTRSILKELLETPPAGYEVDLVYGMCSEVGYHYARYDRSDYTFKKAEYEPVEPQNGDIFLGLDFQYNVILAQCAYFTMLRQIGVSIFFLVHDLLPILLPQAFESEVEELYTRWLNAITQFDGAVCVSKTTADDLIKWFQVHGPERLRLFKIGWSHIGADIENSFPTIGLPADSTQMLKLLRSCPSFLMVGTVEPRKGHAQTLSAFEQLWADGFQVNLVIVGKQGWKMDGFLTRIGQHSELNSRLFWLNEISDEYLLKIYSTATCLIAASEGEGFGLPLIEAAQHNLPIIARDIPVFHEVAGDYAFYFNGKDPRNLAVSLKEWLALYEKDQQPSSDQMPRLTWQQSAERMKQIIIEGDWYRTI